MWPDVMPERCLALQALVLPLGLDQVVGMKDNAVGMADLHAEVQAEGLWLRILSSPTWFSLDAASYRDATFWSRSSFIIPTAFFRQVVEIDIRSFDIPGT